MGQASFGKYWLIAELGHGGMADVFLAVVAGPVGSGFSKLMVIKRLRQNLAEEPEFVEMLVDEARISARLNHPNVVQTNEVGSVEGMYFLAMEYLDGQPLHRIQYRATQTPATMGGSLLDLTPSPGSPPPSGLIPADPFPRELQYLVLCDALAGLHHAHELADYNGTPLEIVHRDVTPHNIFVTYEGQVKVVDFGIAKAVGRASETRQGVVKGKVRYMAPEQALGRPVDRRADVFSVGVMLWEVATGRRLWKDLDDIAVVQALVGGKIPSSPKLVDPNVPDEIDRICVKALSHRREDRYDTAEDLRLELEQFLADSGKLVVARRRLGPAVAALFRDKRDEIKSIIESQLHAVDRQLESHTDPPRVTMSVAPSQRAFASSGAVAVPTQADSGEIPTALVNVPPHEARPAGEAAIAPTAARGRSWRTPALVASAVVTLVIASVVIARAFTHPQEEAMSASGPASASGEAPHASARVKVTVAPADATLAIDGAPVPSPYDAVLSRDDREHTLTVEARGFEPHVESFRLDNDVTIMVTLKKPTASSSARPPVLGSRAAVPNRGKPVTVTTPPSPPPPVVPAAPPVPVVAPPPATASHKPAPVKPDIDKGDPWGGSR